MTTEEKLKQLILTQYKSVREFTQKYEIPYSTMTTIFKRGINCGSISTVIKICQALGISTDELISGRITFVNEKPEPKKVEDFIVHLQHQLQNTDDLTLNGQPINDEAIDGIVKSLDLLIEIEKKNINKYLNN